MTYPSPSSSSLISASGRTPRVGAVRPILVALAFACAALFALLPSVDSALAEAEANSSRPSLTKTSGIRGALPAPEDVLFAYNDRDLGGSGLRRIHLELRNDGVVTRQFRTIHGWQADDDRVRSLVLLEQPHGLLGTCYLLAEGEQYTGGIEIFLQLATAGPRTLEVRPGHFDEGLLGSDFGYSDLLWQIPTKGRSLDLMGSSHLEGQKVWVVDVKPATEEARLSTNWDRVRYYIGQDPMLLVGADFFSGPTRLPSKELRIDGWRQVDGVWTPSEMVMSVDRRRQSVLTLDAAYFRLDPFDTELFTPNSLTELARQLREGETPSFLEEYAP
ncbi:MAG: outer membrane lipoprotein-sorting protein [Acidobacteriota bacterium]